MRNNITGPNTLAFFEPDPSAQLESGTPVFMYADVNGLTHVGIANGGLGSAAREYPAHVDDDGRLTLVGLSEGCLSESEVAAIEAALGYDVDPKLLEQLPDDVRKNPLKLVEPPVVISEGPLHVPGRHPTNIETPSPAAPDTIPPDDGERIQVTPNVSIILRPPATPPSKAEEWQPVAKPREGRLQRIIAATAAGAVGLTGIAAVAGHRSEGTSTLAGAAAASTPAKRHESSPKSQTSQTETSKPKTPKKPTTEALAKIDTYHPAHGPNCMEAKDVAGIKFVDGKVHLPSGSNYKVKFTIYEKHNGKLVPVTQTLDEEQIKNVSIIIETGIKMGMTPWEITVAVATSRQEADYYDDASPEYKDTIKAPDAHRIRHGDHDSVDEFQQRPQSGWGAAASDPLDARGRPTPAALNDRAMRLMDPAYAATQFYKHLRRVGNVNAKCLTVVAQDVQNSGYPDAYAKWGPASAQLVDRFATGNWASVVHYPAASKTETTRFGDLSKVTSYKQTDDWGVYGTYTVDGKKYRVGIGRSGCGPTEMATILSTLTGHRITPTAVAHVAAKEGQLLYNHQRPGGGFSAWSIGKVVTNVYRSKGYNVNSQFIGTIAEKVDTAHAHNRRPSEQVLEAGVQNINRALEAGALVITAGDGNLPFTGGGHFIVIRAAKIVDGKVVGWYVSDSDSVGAHMHDQKVLFSPMAIARGMHWWSTYAVSDKTLDVKTVS